MADKKFFFDAVANSQYRNAVASGPFRFTRSCGKADPTLPRFGTDCLPLRSLSSDQMLFKTQDVFAASDQGETGKGAIPRKLHPPSIYSEPTYTLTSGRPQSEVSINLRP